MLHGWWMVAGGNRIIAGDSLNLVVLSCLSTSTHGHTLVAHNQIRATIKPVQLIQLIQP